MGRQVMQWQGDGVIARLMLAGVVSSVVACATPANNPQAGLAPETQQSASQPPGAGAATTLQDNINELIRAARYGQLESVEALLKQQVPVDGRDVRGNTALMAATEGGYVKIAERLIVAGADVNAQNNDRRTALMGTAIRGDSKTLQLLLAQGAKVDVADQRGETALFDAVRNGHLEVVQMLLTAGANPNQRNALPISSSEANFTPLMIAAKYALANNPQKWQGIMNELLTHGADVNTINGRGDSALSVATQYGNTQIAALLRQGGARERLAYTGVDLDSALIAAARDGQRLKAQQALAQGANPNAANRTGVSALLAACYGGDLEIVQALVERGAGVNKINDGLRAWTLNAAAVSAQDRELVQAASRGETPLMVAARRGQVQIVTYLLQQGADESASNNQNETALVMAAEQGHDGVVKLLVNRGPAGVDVGSDAAYSQALIKATQGGYDAVVTLLLGAGANPNYRGYAGKSALYWAVERGDMSTAKAILHAGANPNLKSDAGLSPLMEAAKTGRAELINVLLEAGSDINATEGPDDIFSLADKAAGSGMTALMLAANNGHEEVVKLLLAAGADTAINNRNGHNAADLAQIAGFEAVVRMIQGRNGERHGVFTAR